MEIDEILIDPPAAKVFRKNQFKQYVLDYVYEIQNNSIDLFSLSTNNSIESYKCAKMYVDDPYEKVVILPIHFNYEDLDNIAYTLHSNQNNPTVRIYDPEEQINPLFPPKTIEVYDFRNRGSICCPSSHEAITIRRHQ